MYTQKYVNFAYIRTIAINELPKERGKHVVAMKSLNSGTFVKTFDAEATCPAGYNTLKLINQ